MQSRNESTKAVRTIDTWSGNNHTMTSGMLPSSSTSFSVITDVTTGAHNVPHPNRFTRTKYVYCTGYTAQVLPASGTTVVGPSSFVPAHAFGTPIGYDTATYNKALSRAYSRARGQVDLAISLAEHSQTTRMLRAVGKLSRYVRTFNPRKWGDKWLEYQYGWRPLVQDVFETANELRAARPRDMRFSVTAVGNDRKTGNYLNPLGYGKRETNTHIQWRCRFDLTFQIKPTILQTLGNFGSLNPISIAWELTPYSFVVDWLIDIGGYLRNLETAMLYGSMFKMGYYTEGYRVLTNERMSGYRSSDALGQESHLLIGNIVDTGKNRVVLSAMPFPRAPGFHGHLGWERILSAAALMKQHVGKR